MGELKLISTFNRLPLKLISFLNRENNGYHIPLFATKIFHWVRNTVERETFPPPTFPPSHENVFQDVALESGAQRVRGGGVRPVGH